MAHVRSALREDSESAAEGSAGDQIATSKDKKRKKDHSVVLEEGSQIDITKMGEKRESKKKRRKEIDTVGPDLSQNAMVRGEEADVDNKNDKKKKKGKERIGGAKRGKEMAAPLREDSESAAEVSAGDQIATSKDKKRKKDHSVVLEEGCQIDITNKMGEKREGKKKRRKETDRIGPDLSQNATVRGEEADVDGKKDKKKKKGKERIGGGQREKYMAAPLREGSESAAEVSAGDQIVTSKEKKIKKDHSVVLEEGSQIDITKMGEKRDGKKKRRKETDKVGPDLSQIAMVRGEEADVDTKNDKKKKKGKERIGGGKREKEMAAPLREDSESAAEVSDGDQTATSKDKKRKKDHSVVLEEGSQIDITKMGEKREGKMKRRKETDQVGPDFSQNATIRGEEADVDGKNDKKKKKGKERIGGGKREKEMAARLKGMGRRVSFADDVEVFSIDGGDNEVGDRSGEFKLVHGQRFTLEEDTTLMEAIMNYAEMKQLGEKGLEMIRASSKHPELKGCWADIGKSLPHRPAKAIYKRARILLYRSDERKWTQEEYEKIRRFVGKNGTDWTTLAKELGKSHIHVKDTWRRIKPKNLKTGAWTQDEYQNLFDLVNLDLRVKAHQEYDPGHRLLRDNISWEAISEKLTTRNHKNCCLKWYHQLASPLVKQGIWNDADDYRLLEELQKVEAVCVEDVDWESLLDHRSGEVCRQRWNQMVRNIGSHKEKPFIEQLEVLSNRYRPEMLDYRK